MSKVLLVLTEQFPYGTGEAFLESEMPFWDKFDRVIICPLSKQKSSEIIRQGIRFELLNIHIKRLEQLIEIPKVLFDHEFLREISILKHKSSNKRESIKKLLSMTVNMRIYARKIVRIMKDDLQPDDQLYLYAYWLYNPAYVAALIKDYLSQVEWTISRAHGFDIYEYRNNNYLPYRKIILEKVDAVYCVSNNGVNYLKELYPFSSAKIYCAYLGTNDYGIEIYQPQNETIRIVSCSSCIKLKRINLIIDALSQLKKSGLSIEWTHFGGGPLLDALKLYAKEQLGDSITYIFTGTLSNSEIMNEYKCGQYDLFINVSETEGIPVSIMEAMSFGIPALATDVGGTSELVNDGVNGYLMNPDVPIAEIANKIHNIALLDKDKKMNLRINARKTWEDHFCANNNFLRFCDKLINGLQ